MPFYEYNQNNSGGSFTGPAMYVLVEANNADEANYRAEQNGLYFNGCDAGLDCDCCGDRWYSAWRDGGQAEPMIYGKPVDQFVRDSTSRRSKRSREEKIPLVLIVYADGHTETR